MNALPIIDYDRNPDYHGLPRDDEDLRRRVLATFEPLLESKRRSMAGLMEAVEARVEASSDSTIAELSQVGAAGLRLPASRLAELKRLFGPANLALERYIDKVRADGRRLKFRDTELVIHQDGQMTGGREELAGAALKVVQEAGALDIAEGYYPGFTCIPWNIVFRRNVANQDFFRARDGGTPRAAGMHIDSNARPCLNGVIYLNDVGPDQGPFKYVAGSSRWRFDPEDRAIRKAVDDAGIAGGGRKLFIQLPPPQRRKASFGFDIADDTPLSSALLSRERAYTSDLSDMVLFYSDGVHRGGDVAHGHRLSILFTLQMRPRKRASLS